MTASFPNTVTLALLFHPHLVKNQASPPDGVSLTLTSQRMPSRCSSETAHAGWWSTVGSPQLRDKLATICDNYLTVQQDILETFVDRGQLRKLAEPTVLGGGKRIPGLKLDNPRQLALMHALVRFAHIAAGNTFTTAELYPHVLAALQMSANQYSLASLRYDLSKLRVKALVEKLPQSRRYRLCPQGYCICLVFLKLFERIYAPLAAGLLQPYRSDSKLKVNKRTQLDRLYQKVLDNLEELVDAVGLKAA